MRMTVEFVGYEDLFYFVSLALSQDNDIIQLFDKKAGVETVKDCVDSICDKIRKNYPQAKFRGVYVDNKPAGYYLHDEGSLISFGISPIYRNKEVTSKFFDTIKGELGNEFSCMLYSHNTRAIKWLEKQGMVKVFDNITILQSCQ